LVNSIETPHRVTVFLKLQYPPKHAGDYHLQAELFKEKWATIEQQPLPWYVRLDPARLILMA
jgi:molybdate transport system permease protein